MKLLLTGGSGFIGSYVLNVLLERGYEVHVVVHSQGLRKHARIIEHQLDLLDLTAAESFIRKEKFTHLLHMAWYMGVGAARHQVNLKWLSASISLLDNFSCNGGKVFLGSGSSAEYECSGKMGDDANSAQSPYSLYGVCKQAFYMVARNYCASIGLRFLWPRIFNCYGGGDNGAYRLVPSVISSCLRGEDVRVSDCERYKNFVYVEDVARGIVDLMESTLEGTVDVCSDTPVCLRSVVETIVSLTRFKGNVLWGSIPSEPSNTVHLGDNSKLRSTGWGPRYDLIRGLQKTVDCCKEALTAHDMYDFCVKQINEHGDHFVQ